jgi:murein DD-endopeptidase MepM/ murein hydrolase activator NlpD
VSHSGSYKGSIDFAVPVLTEVYAAADGKVVRVKDDSKRYGQEPRYGQDANYITIEHPHNELSEYLHLEFGSAVVKVGDEVVAGQLIAKTGLSSLLYAPYLHFMVYKKVSSAKDFQCLGVSLR